MMHTDAWGIDDRYEDASGQERTISPGTIEALRQRSGDRPPPSTAAVPVVARRGESVPGGVADVVLEDGGELRVYRSWPPDLPFGYHLLRPADDGPERRLIVTPGRCHLPTRWRAWGWAVQLYAARSRSSWGIGDLADLGRLNRWATEELGAGFVLINPLHAVAPTVPQQPSPYFPASRRFRNPIYLRVEDAPGAELAAAELEPAAAAGRALNDRREIDRDEVWRLKLGVLGAVWDRTAGGAGFERWWRAQGPALREFCTWSVLSERFGPRWRSWSGEYQHPRNPAVDRFAADHTDRVRFFAWLQRLVEQQLDDATAGLAVIQDLPIGVDPEGADAWAWQDLFAADVTVGAPPDQFNVQGQDWGLPPFIPWRLQEAGYQPFIDTIRATIPRGGGLRIDHVMGLFRLWWIPAGADPAGGAYVRYPAGDLLDIVALESHRAGAVVVGEDLGTVESGVREAMAERAMLSYRLLWFEEAEPAGWPEPALAAVTTHDLPTVAGLWTGSDLDEQRGLGLDVNERDLLAIRRRLADTGGLGAGDNAPAAVVAAHRLLAGAPSVLLAATLDDAVAEPCRPNLPGVDSQRPNWSLALPVPLDDLERHPLATQVAATLAEAVGAENTPSRIAG